MKIVRIKGMSCQHCVGSTRKALEQIPGIKNVVVDLEKGEARYDGEVNIEEVKKAVAAIGFEVIS